MDTHIPSGLLDDLDQLDSLNLTSSKAKVIKPKKTVPTSVRKSKKDQRADELAAAFGVINEFMPRPSSKHSRQSRENGGTAGKPSQDGGGGLAAENEEFSDSESVGALTEDINAIRPAAIRKKEAQAAKQLLEEMLLRLTAISTPDSATKPKYSAMDSFLRVLDKEQTIYENFFGEIIRQIGTSSPERAHVLEEIRKQYKRMFEKVPQFVANIFNQSAANSKIIHRVYSSLTQAKNTTADLIPIVENLIRGDSAIATKNSLMESKFVEALNEIEASDSVRKSFYALIKSQRDDFEAQLQQAEKEKRKSMEISLTLATKLGVQIGLPCVRQVFIETNSRSQHSNDFVIQVSAANDEECLHISSLYSTWQKSWINFIPVLRQRDQENINQLKRIHADMNNAHKALLLALKGESDMDTRNAYLESFKRIDRDMISTALADWEKTMTGMLKSYSSEATRSLFAGMMRVQDLGNGLNSSIGVLLNRAEVWMNGSDYHKNRVELNNLFSDFSKSISDLQRRIQGNEDTLVRCKTNRAIMEDRYNYIMSTDNVGSLSNPDCKFVMESIERWKEDIHVCINEIELRTAFIWGDLPKKVEQVTFKVLDRVKADTEMMTEENNALLFQMRSAVVDIINNITADKAEKTWQNQHLQLNEAMSACDYHLSQYATGLKTVDKNGNDLVVSIRKASDGYSTALNNLIQRAKERRAAIKDLDPILHFLPPTQEIIFTRTFNIAYNLNNPQEENDALTNLREAIDAVLQDDDNMPIPVLNK